MASRRGGGATDLMAVMEAFGEALLVEPFLSTIGLGAQLVARGATREQRERILPAIAEGRLTMAFAQTERHARYDLARVATRATRKGDGYAIDGEKRVVIHAPCADSLIVSARTEGGDADARGVSLLLVDIDAPGVTMRRFRTLDGCVAADMTFRGVHVEADSLLGEEGNALTLAEDVVDFATALVCAEAIGAI